MKIYLDNCSLNRPFDDQSQVRIKIESEAKLAIQESIREGSYTLVWSYILDFENPANPFEGRRNEISKWKEIAFVFIKESKELIKLANGFKTLGFKAIDSLHIAAASSAQCYYLITTDDGILKKTEKVTSLKIINPVEFFTKELQ